MEANEFQQKIADLKQQHPPGTDIWLYGQESFCIHCVSSISLKSAMVADKIRPGSPAEYIGGPDHYTERLSPAEVEQYREEMAKHGLAPCQCAA